MIFRSEFLHWCQQEALAMKKVHTLCCVCERFDHLRHDQTHDQRLLGGQL